MATLAKDTPRDKELGADNDLPMVGADIVYEGSATGIVDASGHARPLSGGDLFGGFCVQKQDNSSGSAADKNVKVLSKGKVKLSVSGAVITDLGQPVYATDDDTFVFNPVGASFVGFVRRFVSSGVVIVEFDADAYLDPWGHKTFRETLTGTKTFDAEDTGKLFCVTEAGDGDALTLPVIATGLGGVTILYVGPFGGAAVTVDPAAGDMILGPDITGQDNKDLILTKATSRRGDFVTLDLGDADGYVVTEARGTWVREA